MKLNNGTPPALPLSAKSCARCGNTFRAFGREYICHVCRRPKARVHKPANHDLSFREQQIVALVQEAKANKEIAYELRLTEGTVKEYLYHIFRKLNVKSRTELALRWYRENSAPRPAGKESPEVLRAELGRVVEAIQSPKSVGP